MIYIFDKTQAIIKVLTNDDFTAAHLNFKINTATTFEFSLPASKALPSGSKYVATPHPLNDSKFIMLRLTERVDNTETIDYSAYELAYQELATDGYIEDKRPQNQSALNLMKIALNGSNWELNNVNVSGAATTNFYYVDRLSAISKVVDLLGGEIVFYIEIQGNAISGRYMDYLARQGADTSKVFASGSNLLTVERQSDTSGIYTAILPRGKGEEIDNGKADTPDGYGRRINIADVEWKKSAGNPLDKPKGSIVLSDPDATAEWGQINGNARLLPQTYDDIDDVNVLINSAYKTLQSVNHPQIQYSATVADVGGLSLGDTVLIMHGDRDLSYKTRVFEVKYDLLSPDQTELSLGDDLSSNSITSQINSLNAVADTISSQTQWTINQIGRPSTTFGNTEPANPKVGDVFFKELPDGGTEIYRWSGDIWELLASPTTADDIAKAVDDAVTQSKSHTDEVKQVLSSDIATAKSQAASLASTAEANAKSEAVSQFNRAQNALSAAKTDLTKSIASEASARNQAVSAANSQAQTYANQAKDDALNTIAKEVTDRQNAVSALDTKATNAVNQAKSDINDTIKAISVGGRNYFLNSSGSSLDKWNNNSSLWSITTDTVRGSVFTSKPTVAWTGGGQNDLYQSGLDVLIGQQVTISFWAKADKANSNLHSEPQGGAVVLNTNLTTSWAKYSYTIPKLATATIYFMSVDVGTNYYLDNLKVEIGNQATDWTPAPEDVVLDYTTKDNKIKETITQYKETTNGHVSRLQTDVETALGQVATKVSQTDYDKKTGDLATKYTQVKQTADSQAADIVDIKKTATSQASKINSISSDVDGTKQIISDIKKTQDSQSDKVNQITNDVNGTKQSITDIQTKDEKQDTRMGTIETSVSGVKSDFSSYKTTNDGAVKTAQTTAQTAVDGLKTKVSQNDYNTKTGQLQTDLTTTTQTANQAKTDIVSIKQKDGDQDARMTQIESDASGVKTTVSDLKTAQDKQSGYISTLQQSAKGFEASIRDINGVVNDLQQINQITNSEFTPDFAGWHSGSDQVIADETSNVPAGWYRANGRYYSSTIVGNVLSTGTNSIHTDLIPVGQGTVITGSAVGMSNSDYNGTVTLAVDFAYYDSSKKLISNNRTNSSILTDWTRITLKATTPSNTAYVSFGIVTNGNTGTNYYSQPLLVFADVLGNYVRGSYNNNGATAKAQLTADNAAFAVTKLTSADGIITKAQADIQANADAINEKVSKTEYDQKTGELSKTINEAKDTADESLRTIGDYKTSNDKRVHEAESSIERTARAITETVTRTDYDGFKGSYNSKMSEISSTFDRITSTVSDTETIVNKLNQNNLVNNSQLNPDYSGWHITSPWGKSVTTELWNNSVESSTGAMWVWHDQSKSGEWIYSDPVAVFPGLSLSASVTAAMPSPPSSGIPLALYVYTYDANKNRIDSFVLNISYSMVNGTFTKFNLDNRIASSGAKYASVVFGWNVAGMISFGKPMLMFGKTTGDYVAGPYNNNDKIASQQITIDGINNFVRDSSGNISSDFQTALSKTSIITGSTLASSIQTQTSSQISSALKDNNGKIISSINQDSSGVKIAGKNIVLDGDTTVTGDFYAKGGNFKNLNASNMTVGTLNGTNVNITNINANNIVSGAISGANLNINLNTGSVVFQKGRINSSDYTTDINIDQGYISTANSDTRAILKNGQLQLTSPNYYDLQKNPYLSIYNDPRAFDSTGKFNSAVISARDRVIIGNKDGLNDMFWFGDTYYFGQNSFYGLSSGTTIGKAIPTIVGGGKTGVVLVGGSTYTNVIGGNDSPSITVGWSPDNIYSGNRVMIQGDRVHIPSIYNRTWSTSSNVYVAADGSLYRTSSARKYKLDIKNNIPIADSLKLIDVPLSTWVDKHEHEENGSNERYFGMIAEDLRDAGLEYLVQYGEDSEVEGINYDRVALLLIPLVKELKERIEELESEGK